MGSSPVTLNYYPLKGNFVRTKRTSLAVSEITLKCSLPMVKTSLLQVVRNSVQWRLDLRTSRRDVERGTSFAQTGCLNNSFIFYNSTIQPLVVRNSCSLASFSSVYGIRTLGLEWLEDDVVTHYTAQHLSEMCSILLLWCF